MPVVVETSMSTSNSPHGSLSTHHANSETKMGCVEVMVRASPRGRWRNE